MKIKPLLALYQAQFLSAFADNMILFITLALIKANNYPDYYLPLVQGCFLFSYVVLAPWVGRVADKHAKSRVLLIGNAIKLAGIGLLAMGIDPALSYAVVGAGAVVYSPAKYGILPELTENESQLLKANSNIEGFTILAILVGTVAGGALSDISIVLALLVCGMLYLCSIGLTFAIPRKAGRAEITYSRAIVEFWSDLAALFSNRACHFSLVGTGSFWMASAVLRLVVIAWIPLSLGITSNTTISLVISSTGIGIIFGALLTPKLISMAEYPKSRWYGLVMAIMVFAFCFINNLYLAVAALLIVGFAGGVFIVPMNAVLQNEGHHSIGAGKTIAIQNFVENTLMLAGVAAYTFAAKAQTPIDASIVTAGLVFCSFIGYLFWFKGKKPIQRQGQQQQHFH